MLQGRLKNTFLQDTTTLTLADVTKKIIDGREHINSRPLRHECRCFWHQQVDYAMRGTWTNALSLWRMEVGRNKGLVGSSQLSHIYVTTVCLTTLQCAFTQS